NRRTSSGACSRGGEDPTTTHTKRRRYGRSRARRRAILVLLVVVGILAILPFALRLPDAVMRIMYPLRYESAIRQASEENDLDPTFVAGVIYTESRFKPDAESHRGAYGLMQLLPESARFIQRQSGIEGDYRDPEVNIRLGTWFLGYLEDRYKGEERLMLAAYNSGEGNVDAWVSDEGFDIANDIPFKETRDYVDRALEAQRTYQELYGKNLQHNPG
ncbi:MAG TPA: lytic transglycosylase domain-containing protein, partial [Rubrobacter sp.]|nr:lytic transglycosylase domain-containing protein [Rubrobacter sp.]